MLNLIYHILFISYRRWIAFVLLMVIGSCQPPSKPQSKTIPTQSEVQRSREQLLSGDVEKKWRDVPLNDTLPPTSTPSGRRFIFYRNYNLTTLGSYGSRQGHWSLDNDAKVSFHFEGPDSIIRFDILQLDTNILRLRSRTGDEFHFQPE